MRIRNLRKNCIIQIFSNPLFTSRIEKKAYSIYPRFRHSSGEIVRAKLSFPISQPLQTKTFIKISAGHDKNHDQVPGPNFYWSDWH